MGTEPASIASFFPLLRNNAFQPGPEARSTAPESAPRADRSGGEPAAVRGQADGLEDRFTSTVYRLEQQQLSLSARFRQVTARTSEDGAGSAAVQGQQLTFDFFAESRTEELTRFTQRTDNVAEGLEGARQTRFRQVTQRVAFRFEASFTVTGAELNGFANGAEGLQGQGELFDRFTAMADRLLDQAQEFLNEFLGLFEGPGAEADMAARLQQALDEFASGRFFERASDSPAGGGTQAQASVQQLEFSFAFSGEITVTEAEVEQSDPITLDLDGDGIELTSFQEGARFDILGNGRQQNTAFVTGGDAFLALDRNGDGVVNSGLELFGDQGGARNGFEELRRLDSNGDNRIDRADEAFDELLLFRDNGDGRTDRGELITLAQAGIASLSLDYLEVDQAAEGGNRIAQIASFRRTDGSLGRTADAILNYTA